MASHVAFKVVPTYDYECDQCHRTFEVRQRITEEPLKRCEVCGGPLRRLLSPAPFILKGEGWYVTDYPSESRKKAMQSETKSSTSTDTSTSTPATNATNPSAPASTPKPTESD